MYLTSLEVVREAMRLSGGAFRGGRGDERDDGREEGLKINRAVALAVIAIGVLASLPAARAVAQAPPTPTRWSRLLAIALLAAFFAPREA